MEVLALAVVLIGGVTLASAGVFGFWGLVVAGVLRIVRPDIRIDKRLLWAAAAAFGVLLLMLWGLDIVSGEFTWRRGVDQLTLILTFPFQR